MKRLLSAVAESPLVVSGRHEAGNYTTTLDYIPGTALRGATAAIYLESPHLQQEITSLLQPFGRSFQDYFQWVFLSGQVCFPNLYPRREKPFSFPIPLSARSCKRFPGFGSESLYAPCHGVCDVLLKEPFDFRCAGRLGDRLTGYVPCEAPMEPFEGFYEGNQGDHRDGHSVEISRRVITRTAIENLTEVVQQGQLYSLEALEEGGSSYPVYAGLLGINLPKDLPEPCGLSFVEVLLKHLNDPLARLAIGRAKTRGLGTVRLEVSEEEPSTQMSPLEERFNELQKVWQQVGSTAQEQFVFTVTLYSDVIILDNLWRYSSVLDENLLVQEHPGAPAFRLKQWFTHTRLVSGWNAAHRLPKENELAILRGSAFLYGTKVSRTILLPWLQALEEGGVGERRNEGFGQIVICHPFHYWGVRS